MAFISVLTLHLFSSNGLLPHTHNTFRNNIVAGWVPTYWFFRHHKQFHGFYGLLLIFPDLGTDHSQIPIPLWPWYSFLHSNPWLLASIFYRGTFHLPVWPKTIGRDLIGITGKDKVELLPVIACYAAADEGGDSGPTGYISGFLLFDLFRDLMLINFLYYSLILIYKSKIRGVTHPVSSSEKEK